jgi:hypothetical protein
LPENDVFISFAVSCFIKKMQVHQSFLPLQHSRLQFSVDGAGLRGLDVDSMNSSSNYFAYLCHYASESTLHQKRMSIADWSHLWWQIVESKCYNGPC